MHTLIIVTSVLLLTSPALAIERLSSPQLSCQQIKNTIERDGDAIVRYPSARTNLTLFKRFVRDERQCDKLERTMPFTVPTSDTNSCRLEYCIDRSLRPKGLFED